MTTQPNPAHDKIIARALRILEERMRYERVQISSPERTKQYLTLKLAEMEREVFGVLMLDSQNTLIEAKELFYGTIDGASVYPREVVKEVLASNAAAVIFYHNHPSGHPEPSLADRQITKRLTEALALIDVRVLDHIIVGGTKTISFSERGLI